MVRKLGKSLALLLLVVMTIGCDRVTKQLATEHLAGEPTRSFLADTFRLTYAENLGGFLSLGAGMSSALRSAVFTVGSLASVLYLISERTERRVAAGERGGMWDAVGVRLPSSTALDRVAYQTIAFAFPLWFFAVVAGAIWAEDAWGRYWGWDPKETWSFVTLVIYAAYLHARSTAGWRGRPAAIIAIIGLAAFLFSYFGVNIFFVGFHSYGGV